MSQSRPRKHYLIPSNSVTVQYLFDTLIWWTNPISLKEDDLLIIRQLLTFLGHTVHRNWLINETENLFCICTDHRLDTGLRTLPASLTTRLHCVAKKRPPPLYILNTSAKTEPILIIFLRVQITRKFHIRLLETPRPPHLNNVAAIPTDKNSPDAVCRRVDNVHNTSTGSCRSYQLITGEDYYKFG